MFKNLQGRSIRVDLVCDLASGRVVNVEVEKNSLNHLKRALYNAAIITTNTTDPGTDFDNVPDVVIIYVTKSDIFHLKQTKYRIDEVIHGLNVVVKTGPLKIFINAAVDDGSSISQLMKIFTKDEVYDYKQFPETSSLKNYYKNTEEGIKAMSDIIERLIGEDRDKLIEQGRKEGRQEGRQEERSDLLITMLKTGMMPEQISKHTNIPLEEIQALATAH